MITAQKFGIMINRILMVMVKGGDSVICYHQQQYHNNQNMLKNISLRSYHAVC